MYCTYCTVARKVTTSYLLNESISVTELAGTTLSADTLPKGEPLANTKLTEKDHYAINQIVHSMQAEETVRSDAFLHPLAGARTFLMYRH